MAGKKENLPLTIEQDDNTTGTITYANEVIAVIAGVAANEIEGIAGMCGNSGFGFGKNKNVTKGVKVELGSEEVAIDVYLAVDYETPIQKAAYNVQENIRRTVESMTGLHVVRVDVHVQSVRFEKDQEPAPSLNEKDYGETPKPIHVEFEGQPTPADAHEPSVDFVPKNQADGAIEPEEVVRPAENEADQPADAE